MKAGVAVIGAGLQARRRLPVISLDPHYELVEIVDRDEDRARALAKTFSCKSAGHWREAVENPNVSIVLCLTYPDSHAEIAIAAMNAGKDVLCEKPLARTAKEAQAMADTARNSGRVLKCGFNHRFHPAIVEAHRLFKSGCIGRPVFGRGRYGIGGRVGLETEWRSDPAIVGGGQLMEQGIHLVDLFRWFLGDMTKVTGLVASNVFSIGPLEDNGFAVMQNKDGVISSIHSSLAQWTNLFEFELFGEEGSLVVQGLGASYGVEQLIVSARDPSGPFSHKTLEFRGEDQSWRAEWSNFTGAIEGNCQLIGDGNDGLRAMQIVEAVYSASKNGRTVPLE